MSGQCKILWDDSVQAFRVATPYNPQFVELLKQIIPASDRVWDPASKIWTVAAQFGVPMKALCEKLFGQANVTYVDQAESQRIAAQRAAAAAAYQAQAAQAQYQYVPPKAPPRRGDPLDVVMLNFVRVLPYEAARSAYRSAAAQLHPDKQGGDASRMTLLNTTWARIEQEYYGKVKTQ